MDCCLKYKIETARKIEKERKIEISLRVINACEFKKKTRNVTVCNKCPRISLIMTLIPGCDLEHSQGTLTLGVGT